jgi:thiamine-phosphate pyrophosphorylase
VLEDRRLYLVAPARPDLEDFLEAAIRGGVDVVQIRDRELSDRALLTALELAREVTRRHGVPFVVNDRADLAQLVDADLVHVGQHDLPVAAARRLGLAIGLSTHSPQEIDSADADYLGVGPVFATPTKPGRPAVGLELVRYAVSHAKVPWFAIGGIDETTVQHVVEAGATRVAVVRAICDAPDTEAAARILRYALERQPVRAGSA